MSRRFQLRPGQSGAGNWQQTIVMPPRAPPGDAGGGGGDPGGGTPEMFVAGCMSPFVSDGQIMLLAIHNLPPDAEVEWTATALDDWNYLISEDGLTSTAHACMAAFFGGSITVTATVGGEEVGSLVVIDGGLVCPESWPSSNPRFEP